jgi:hypothetical protein
VALVGMLKIVLPVFSVLLRFWFPFVRPRDLSAWLLLACYSDSATYIPREPKAGDLASETSPNCDTLFTR